MERDATTCMVAIVVNTSWSQTCHCWAGCDLVTRGCVGELPMSYLWSGELNNERVTSRKSYVFKTACIISPCQIFLFPMML